MPLIVSWPGTVTPGVSHALVSQIDLLASLGRLTGAEVPEADSQDLLDAFLGLTAQGRENLVLEATGRTAFRQGEWVLIPPHDGPAVAANVNIELGNSPDYQLYHLTGDPGETRNLARAKPEKLQEMMAAYQAVVHPE